MVKIKRKIFFLIFILIIPIHAFSQSNLENIRFGHHSTYARVAFDFDSPILYHIDNQINEKRLFLKFDNCLSQQLQDGFINISTNSIVNSIYLKKIKNNKIILRIEAINEYKFQINELENPWRLIVDIIPEKIPEQIPEKFNRKPRPLINKYQRGLEFMKSNNYDEAIKNFNETILENSNYSLANFQLGQIYCKQNDLSKSIGYFQKVRKSSPIWDDAQLNISNIQDEIIQLANTDVLEDDVPVDIVSKIPKISESQISANQDSIASQNSTELDSLNIYVEEKEKLSKKSEYLSSFDFSFSQLLVIAFIINSVLFASFIFIINKIQSRNKKQKYRKVLGTTKISRAKKVKSKKIKAKEFKKQNIPEFKSVVKKTLEKNQKPPVKVTDLVKRRTTKFEISEKPIQKVENAYLKNINSDTKLVPAQKSRRSVSALFNQIEELLAFDLDIKTIAKELNLGQDEVKMIINMYKMNKPKNNDD